LSLTRIAQWLKPAAHDAYFPAGLLAKLESCDHRIGNAVSASIQPIR